MNHRIVAAFLAAITIAGCATRGETDALRESRERVVLAREMSNAPVVVVACQPTRGLDVGAIEYMGARLRQAAVDGVGVLLISSELDELVVTDTIPLPRNASSSGKIRVLSCAQLLAETILRINRADSVSSLFVD